MFFTVLMILSVSDGSDNDSDYGGSLGETTDSYKRSLPESASCTGRTSQSASTGSCPGVALD